MLSRYGNKSYAEIANELNISVNTVKYHIKKALSLFREELKDYLLTITALYFYLFNQ
ncbi:sigma factor-like helix-turn-helix DNA-binding protein [Bacteroides salyersiae]|uniref:sigma factor-like helix-turn-helix DNA-binding protein n=1 Tax=Bacteroides salyersiae TaxID=291644 RepID=UPI00293D59D7|nr:sigma factor-like helix-turn-helix DNA-binding protein [Bacteroides salyersiae]